MNYQTPKEVKRASKGSKKTALQSSIRHHREILQASSEELWENPLLYTNAENCALCQKYMKGVDGGCGKCPLIEVKQDCGNENSAIGEAIKAFHEMIYHHVYKKDSSTQMKNSSLNKFREKERKVVEMLEELLENLTRR
jgi:hypothetical protein